MRLADEVREQIQLYMDGDLSSEQLMGWLDSVSDEIDAANDPTLHRLVGTIYTVVAEFGYGHRTWIELRGELGKAFTVMPRLGAPRPGQVPL
jgi:hypothetical protein